MGQPVLKPLTTGSWTGRPTKKVLYLAPQGEPLLAFLSGQPVQRGRLAQARQVRVAAPARQRQPRPGAGLGGAVPRLAPGSQVRPQPFPRLLPPTRPLLFPHARGILAATAAGQGGGAGGAGAVAGARVLRQGRVRGEGVGVKAGQGERTIRELADPE